MNGGGNPNGTTSITMTAPVKPYAVTFQAHPEYISPTGFNVNYINTVQAMEDRRYITPQMSKEYDLLAIFIAHHLSRSGSRLDIMSYSYL
eukprot:scaffold14411_cov108-Skeletonema_menzelii.AAC.1